MTTSTNKTCLICGETFPNPYRLLRHRKEMHRDQMRKFSKSQGDVYAKFAEGANVIKQALKEVDAERNMLQNKLRELDDLHAKYSKFINPNA